MTWQPIIEGFEGKVFGDLTVGGQMVGVKDKNETWWLCDCSCGELWVASKAALESGQDRHCGCKKESGTKRIDIEGNRYGMLTVIREASRHKSDGRRWLCECDCGTFIVAAEEKLDCGYLRSCRCIKSVNLIGKRYGKLEVVAKCGHTKGHGPNWFCRCDCGAEQIIRNDMLKTRICCKHCSHKKLSPKYNLVGMRSGKLLVVKWLGTKNKCSYWHCKCDCGTDVEVRQDGIRSQFVKSCGCSRIGCGMPKTDLTGNKYNKWTVVRWSGYGTKHRAYWLCRCECNRELSIRQDGLLNGTTKSCKHCAQIIDKPKEDLSGLRFGKLLVENWELKKTKNGKNRSYWLCKCECGNKILARHDGLTNGSTQSCGKCRFVKDITGKFFYNIKKGAIIRGFQFSITAKYAWELFLRQDKKCALTGLTLVMDKDYNTRKRGCRIQTASLDRIDSTKGYTIENVRWVHKTVNIMRMNMTDEEFVYWCNLVSVHSSQT